MLLKVEGLYKSYGSKIAVKNFTMEIDKGEVVGILGPNGAGKTTSFYMVCGLIASAKGSVIFEGKNVEKMSFSRRSKMGIGYLPQESSIFKTLSVRDNIMSGIEIRHKDPALRERIYNEIVTDLHITHVQDRKGSLLSGGERRRVEVGRLLGISPKLILLDEPFAGVDPVAISEIKDIIQKLSSKGIGVVITDHNVLETLRIVDRSYVMYDGRIIAEGNAEAIKSNELVRKVYLGNEFK